MPPLAEQIDEAVNLARIQAQEFINLAAFTSDEPEAARLIGRAEALRDLATEAASFATPTARRRALLLLRIRIPAEARALDERHRQLTRMPNGG